MTNRWNAVVGVDARRALVMGSLLVAWSMGCAGQPASPEGSGADDLVSARFALKADVVAAGCPARLVYPDVRSIRLRLFQGTPDSPDAASPLFDTSSGSFAPDGCLSFVQCAGASVRMDANDGRSQDAKAAACEAEGGVLVAARSLDVVKLQTATGVTAFLEAFADDACSERVFVGMRGDISITKGSTDTYALSPLCVGHFTELPHPGQDNPGFSRSVALTDCERDCDCIDEFAEAAGGRSCTEAERALTSVPGAALRCQQGACTRGYAFEALLVTECSDDDTCTAIYSEASCDTAAGYCTVDSYFPLEPASPRAFHSATALAGGPIALVGGLTAADGTTFDAASTPVELFDPATFTFFRADYQDSPDESFEPSHLGRAFHAAAIAAGGSTLALAGGLRAIDIRVQEEGGVRTLRLGPVATGLDTEANYRSDMTLLDVAAPKKATRGRTIPLNVKTKSGDVEQTLSQPYAGAISDVVANVAGDEHFFTGGFAPSGSPGTQSAGGETAPFANLVINCVYGSNLGANCLVNPNVLSSPRGAAASVCLGAEASGVCDAFAVVGGSRSSTAPVAELFELVEDGSGGFQALESEGGADLRRAKFVRTVSFPSDGIAFTFGGANVELFGGPANLPTFALSLGQDGEGATTLVAQAVDASGAPGGVAATYRTHHTATQMGDDGYEVLVVGGLDGDNRATAQALVFDAESRSYSSRSIALNRARFGHQATKIESGPLAGAILITGGLALDDAGSPRFVPVAEVYVPAK